MSRQDLYFYITERMSNAGILCRTLPLDKCCVRKPYLLEKSGISPSCKGTVFMIAVPYIVPSAVYDPNRNISLYAAARDYHLFFHELKQKLIPALDDNFSQYRFELFSDHSPIDEIDAACRARLGVRGENGLLLTDKYGSFVFLGEIITDASFEEVVPDKIRCEYIPTSEPLPICDRCGACRIACPSQCIAENKTECMSALTQKKGNLTVNELSLLATHPLIWGCDTCQTVCPVNKRIVKTVTETTVDFFKESIILHVDKKLLGQMSEDEFSSRAYAWRGRDTLLRNISIHEKNHKER